MRATEIQVHTRPERPLTLPSSMQRRASAKLGQAEHLDGAEARCTRPHPFAATWRKCPGSMKCSTSNTDTPGRQQAKSHTARQHMPNEETQADGEPWLQRLVATPMGATARRACRCLVRAVDDFGFRSLCFGQRCDVQWLPATKSCSFRYHSRSSFLYNPDTSGHSVALHFEDGRTN